MNKTLLSIALALSPFLSLSQTFTIQQNTTGNPSTTLRGQSFTPSVLGSGSGSTGTGSSVTLKSFAIVYHVDATSEASALYLYSTIPSNATTLTDGSGGTLVATSTSKTSNFPYTVYNFTNVILNKNTTYYALFREDVKLEYGSGADPGPYSGGKVVKNNTGTLAELTTADARMLVTLEPYLPSEIAILSASGFDYTSGISTNSTSTGLNQEKKIIYTIKNTGPGVLTLGTVTSTESSATISVQPASIVAANATTTFEVTCLSSIDQRVVATLSIPNNDENENPFILKLDITYDYPISRPFIIYTIPRSASQVNVYWESYYSTNKYSVERSTSASSGFTEIAQVPGLAAASKFEDHTVTSGVTYYYRVRTLGSNGDVSGFTNTVSSEMQGMVTTPGDWEKKTVFPATGNNTNTVGFSIGDKGYAGLGWSNAAGTRIATKEFWEYTPVSDAWTRKADFPGTARASAAEFVIDGKAYVGLGMDQQVAGGTYTYTYSKDFYAYDPATNTWSPIADFPGTARVYAAAFTLNGKGYVGVGNNASGSGVKEFYEYNPSTNSWKPMADFPFFTYNFATFTINNIGYVVYNSNLSKELYAFDPASGTLGTWTKKADLPFGTQGCTGFALNGKGYVAGGSRHAVQQYDPQTDTWLMMEPYAGIYKNHVISFVIGNKVYVGLADGEGSTVNELWEYNIMFPKLSILTAEALKKKIILSWMDNSVGETGYIIERGEASSATGTPQNFSLLTTSEAGRITYTDATALANKYYTYRIRTKFSDGESNNIYVSAISEYPEALTASRESETSIKISWKELVGSTKYDLERATSAVLNQSISAFTPISQNLLAITHTDPFTESGEPFVYYRVRGTRVLLAFTTLYSDTVSVLMLKSPDNLSALVTINPVIQLAWRDNSSKETGYVIERKPKDTNLSFVAIDTVGASITSFTDNQAARDIRYVYQVRAIRDNYTSFYSNIAEVSTITGIESITESRLNAYPNPASDVLIISRPSAEKNITEVKILSNDGRSINVDSIAAGENLIINVCHLEKGLYIARLAGQNSTYHVRFVKQ